MKKLLKKLKKNQLLSKISACLMIVVILVSSLGVSTFAADETEAEAEYVIPAGTYTFISEPSLESYGSNFGFSLQASITSNSLNYVAVSVGNLSSDCVVGYIESIESDVFFLAFNSVPSDSAFAPDPYFYGWLDDAYRTFTLNEDVTTDEATYTAFMSNIEKPNPHTDSVLDVFTGITGSIMDSLGSAQNVFFTSGLTPWFPEFGEYTEGVATPILNFPSDPPSSFVLEVGLERSVFYRSSIENQFFTEAYFNEENVPLFAYDGNQWFLLASFTPADFSYFSVFIPGDPSLTLLGTLAVIGVGLALCFLFIGLISKFLRNRG